MLWAPQTKDSAEAAWHEWRRDAVTTFVMPEHKITGHAIPFSLGELTDRLPFANFAIREVFELDESGKNARGVEELIVHQSGPGRLEYVSQLRYFNRGVKYMPSSRAEAEATDTLELLIRLYIVLTDRKHRFVESRVSRQVRKMDSRSANYREFVVIERGDARYASALTNRDIIKRLRDAHPVRGHIRTLRAARFTKSHAFVRPHIRGVGDALQPRDYQVREA